MVYHSCVFFLTLKSSGSDNFSSISSFSYFGRRVLNRLWFFRMNVSKPDYVF